MRSITSGESEDLIKSNEVNGKINSKKPEETLQISFQSAAIIIHFILRLLISNLNAKQKSS